MAQGGSPHGRTPRGAKSAPQLATSSLPASLPSARSSILALKDVSAKHSNCNSPSAGVTSVFSFSVLTGNFNILLTGNFNIFYVVHMMRWFCLTAIIAYSLGTSTFCSLGTSTFCSLQRITRSIIILDNVCNEKINYCWLIFWDTLISYIFVYIILF
ncbi:peptidyl-prolyl cis-trans isomerase Pin1 [Iris pallida]|uniref:Peptidyl-prolyl cis-trans isomerase Pin1 n=1 Tax=Iris pallida TaxID=29817 RepID=A0AAX6G281_IRIPA|nr:peptidyl-prolyl cis-trans isomerase Pin1 [Iris pallida]